MVKISGERSFFLPLTKPVWEFVIAKDMIFHTIVYILFFEYEVIKRQVHVSYIL